MSATRAEIDAQRAIAAKAWEEGCLHGRMFASAQDSEVRAERAAQWAAEELPYPTVTRPRVVKAGGSEFRIHEDQVESRPGEWRCWKPSGFATRDFMEFASLLTEAQLDEVRRGPCGPTETVEAE